MDVVAFSQNTKTEADGILGYGSVIPILSNFGTVIMTGSYQYDLMWGSDIDITVLCSDPELDAVSALNRFIDQRSFQKYQLGDFLKFPLTDRQDGMIVVLIHHWMGRRWEIEVWFRKVLPESHIQNTELLSGLSSELREHILRIKHQRQTAGLSSRELNSSTIYKGVVQEGKRKLGEFIKC